MEKAVAEVFHDNLMFYFSRRGGTKKEMAEAIGVTPAMITYWFSGAKTPLFDKIDAICEYLGVTRAQLLTERNLMTIDTISINNNEADLLKTYSLLNMDGKRMVSEYAEMLVMSKRYTKDTRLSRQTNLA